ncbi:MAG: hypothetical protein IKC45_06965 [Clostridia bacterium]|nr:hypothetical protein [Clostridia bacterium]
MKKILSVLIAIVMIFTTLSLFAFAKEEKPVPVVVLQGYSGPTLVYADENGEPIIDPETGDVIKAWPVDFAKIGEQVLTALPGMVAGKLIGEDAIVEALVPIVKDTLMPLVILEDGTSWQNLTYYPKGAKATQVSTLIEKDMTEYIPESVFVEEAIARVGAENVFGFTFDWRKGQVDYAKAVDEYIQEVKEITGSDKVDLMGLSHGGQYGTTYLYYYGDKGDVRNAILANPATGGTTLVSTVMMNEYVDLDLKNVMKFVEHIFDIEEDFNWIFDLLSLDNIVGGANRVLQEERINYRLSNVPSLLDFVPMDRFDEVIENIGLNPETNGKLYYDTVKYHRDIHTGTNLADKFAELQKNGTKIGYIVGCGYTAVSSVGTNSDFLIDTYLGSGGATCAPFGETFEADYVQNGLICDNPNHYHISPEFNIDASTGALPDSTWYVTGQGHGQYFNDPYTRQIVCNFLWNDLETVFDDDRFPQFNYAQKHADNIYVHFNNTDVGYHSSTDTELIIENLSRTSPIHIPCVKLLGADMEYVHEIDTVLQVGEKYVIDITETSLENAEKPFTVAVTCLIDNAMHTLAVKEFGFTAVSDEEMKLYPHLAKQVDNTEDDGTTELPVEPENPTDKPEKPDVKPDEPTTDNNNIVTDVVIPNTDSF